MKVIGEQLLESAIILRNQSITSQNLIKNSLRSLFITIFETAALQSYCVYLLATMANYVFCQFVYFFSRFFTLEIMRFLLRFSLMFCVFLSLVFSLRLIVLIILWNSFHLHSRGYLVFFSHLIESPDYNRLPLIQSRVLKAGTVCDGIRYWSQFAKKYIEWTVIPQRETIVGCQYYWGGLSFNLRTQMRPNLLQNPLNVGGGPCKKSNLVICPDVISETITPFKQTKACRVPELIEVLLQYKDSLAAIV